MLCILFFVSIQKGSFQFISSIIISGSTVMSSNNSQTIADPHQAFLNEIVQTALNMAQINGSFHLLAEPPSNPNTPSVPPPPPPGRFLSLVSL